MVPLCSGRTSLGGPELTGGTPCSLIRYGYFLPKETNLHALLKLSEWDFSIVYKTLQSTTLSVETNTKQNRVKHTVPRGMTFSARLQTTYPECFAYQLHIKKRKKKNGLTKVLHAAQKNWLGRRGNGPIKSTSPPRSVPLPTRGHSSPLWLLSD